MIRVFFVCRYPFTLISRRNNEIFSKKMCSIQLKFLSRQPGMQPLNFFWQVFAINLEESYIWFKFVVQGHNTYQWPNSETEHLNNDVPKIPLPFCFLKGKQANFIFCAGQCWIIKSYYSNSMRSQSLFIWTRAVTGD